MNETEKYVDFLLNRATKGEEKVTMKTFREILRDVATMAILDRSSRKQDISQIDVSSLLSSYRQDIANTLRKYDVSDIKGELDSFENNYTNFMNGLMNDDEERIYSGTATKEDFLFKNQYLKGLDAMENFTLLAKNAVEYCYSDGMYASNRLKYPEMIKRFCKEYYSEHLSANIEENMEKYETRYAARREEEAKRLYKENLLGKNDINPFDFNDSNRIKGGYYVTIDNDEKENILKNIKASEMVNAYKNKAKVVPSGQPVEKEYVRNTLNDIIKLQMVHDSRSGISKLFGYIFGTAVGQEADLIEKMKKSLVESSVSHNHRLSMNDVNKAVTDGEARNTLLSTYEQVWTEEKLLDRHINNYNALVGISNPQKELQEEIAKELNEGEAEERVSMLDEQDKEFELSKDEPEING